MEMIKGYTWGFYSGTGKFMTQKAQESMERLASNGLNWICIPVNCFQETFYSLNIFSLFGRTQTDEEVRFAIRKAKSLGLKVCLKPMVDCLDRSWRARINFPTETDEYWNKWFASYSRFMLYYAKMAEDEGCEMLCTGCEMAGMDSQTEHCIGLIERVREVYHGIIMHNINHGDEFRFPWLDRVDIIGISAYYPVSVEGDNSKETMLKMWAAHRERVRQCAERYGRDVMFAEIGVRNERGCTMYPWDFHHRPDAPFDEQEQADFYETAMQTMWDEPYFRGFFWWDWKAILPPEDKAGENKDFTVFGKKAEKVLKEWYTKKD
ncbi:MAG: hypothetical protein IJ740_18280 [Ruminococcus sp.]|nr:hypothetical protein [Ruminococcus sp.]